jgi:hypothetical protein
MLISSLHKRGRKTWCEYRMVVGEASIFQVWESLRMADIWRGIDESRFWVNQDGRVLGVTTKQGAGAK